MNNYNFVSNVPRYPKDRVSLDGWQVLPDFPSEEDTYVNYVLKKGPGVALWFRHCATSRKVSGSIPSGVTGDFFRSYRRNHMPWGRLSL
jgi:hypothetical protein